MENNTVLIYVNKMHSMILGSARARGPTELIDYFLCPSLIMNKFFVTPTQPQPMRLETVPVVKS